MLVRLKHCKRSKRSLKFVFIFFVNSLSMIVEHLKCTSCHEMELIT